MNSITLRPPPSLDRLFQTLIIVRVLFKKHDHTLWLKFGNSRTSSKTPVLHHEWEPYLPWSCPVSIYIHHDGAPSCGINIPQGLVDERLHARLVKSYWYDCTAPHAIFTALTLGGSDRYFKRANMRFSYFRFVTILVFVSFARKTCVRQESKTTCFKTVKA